MPGGTCSAPAPSAAAGPSATAPAGGGRRSGTGRVSGQRDGRQQLDGVVVPGWTGGGCGGLRHRAGQLERVAAAAAPVLVSGHAERICRHPTGGAILDRVTGTDGGSDRRLRPAV